QDVAPAVTLNFREGDQLANAAVEIAPHPAVKRPQDPIQTGSISKRHRRYSSPCAKSRRTIRQAKPVPRRRSLLSAYVRPLSSKIAAPRKALSGVVNRRLHVLTYPR